MSKTWLLCAFSLVLSSCNPDVWTMTTIYKIENRTAKTLYHSISPIDSLIYNSPIYVDTLVLVNPRDSFEEMKYRHTNLNRFWFGKALVVNMALYNMNDTTCISGKYIPQSKYEKNPSFFSNNYSSKNEDVSKYENVESNLLIVTDSLLQFLKKDYTMLEKFKAYYSKKQ